MSLRIPLLILLLLSLSLSLTAQTRRIAHRSHGGSPDTFAALLDDDHGGGPVPNWDRKDEKWNLHPFIAKVRKHYQTEGDKLRKGNKGDETPKAESKDSVHVIIDDIIGPLVVPAKEDNQQPAPQEASLTPASHDDDQTSGPGLSAASLPEATPFRLARRPAEAPTQGNMTLWLFAGALILTIAPAMYWITRKVA